MLINNHRLEKTCLFFILFLFSLGIAIATKVCPFCGKTNYHSNRYCLFCSSDLSDVENIDPKPINNKKDLKNSTKPFSSSGNTITYFFLIAGLFILFIGFGEKIMTWQRERRWRTVSQKVHQEAKESQEAYMKDLEKAKNYKSPYQMLGVHSKMSLAEIKKVYRDLVKEFHPDSNLHPELSSEHLAEKLMDYKKAFDEVSRIKSREKDLS